MKITTNQQTIVFSYLSLRKGIGAIACALPILLVLGKFLFGGPGVLDSMSAYYYSGMRDVFVGCLWAIGIFLLFYRYAPVDTLLSDLAGAFAILISLFPTAPTHGATPEQIVIGWLHLGFATCFFAILAFFALVLFRKSDAPTPKKRLRNGIYLSCGITIVLCLVSIALVDRLPGGLTMKPPYPVLCFEALAIWAFGIAWAVKGEALSLVND